MGFSFDMLEDKIEFFEAADLPTLEKKVNEQIDHNRALLLEVKSVSHQMHVDRESKRPYYSAVVHFKLKKKSAF
ncbi:YrzA family protein [Ectobacillus panaciterrae]|uniref:YrzA family protein n=1 Tax=Ectobacillus panaciterrae TaxID=363872 RepID=UPI00041C7BA3|nr:YrzA family protein [Ectobacillus panaciterrae]